MMKTRILTTGLEFPEGPIFLPGGDILVSEIRGGRLTRIAPDGTKSTFCDIGGGPGGAAIGPGGWIYVCQNGGAAEWRSHKWPLGIPNGFDMLLPRGKPEGYAGGMIQRVSPDGDIVETVISGDDRVHSPNDIVFDEHGGFYFTDTGRAEGRLRHLGGLYYVPPGESRAIELVFPMEMPNGVGLSPDGKSLYVAETYNGRLWKIEVTEPGVVGSRTALATLPGEPPLRFAMCDSLCVDAEGNVIVATLVRGGVTSVAPDGSVDHFPLPDPMTTNACFGGPELRTLYVTLSSRGEVVVIDDWPTRGLLLYGYGDM